MTKTSGIGANLYVNGYDLSGDVGMVSAIHQQANLLDVTPINKTAMVRIEGLKDGNIAFTAFFDDAAGAAHPVLSALGSGDKYVAFVQDPSAVGKACALVVGKQVDYSGTRGNDGSLAFNIEVQSSDAEGLRWGSTLTAGAQTDTGAGNGTSVDNGAATAFGAIVELQVFSFTGTDATVKIQDSANNSAWADLSGAGFTQITAGPTYQRIQLGAAATVRQYVRAVVSTSAGFTSMTYFVGICRRYS